MGRLHVFKYQILCYDYFFMILFHAKFSSFCRLSTTCLQPLPKQVLHRLPVIQCLPLSIYSILSLPQGHPAAAYIFFFLVFPSLLCFLLSFLACFRTQFTHANKIKLLSESYGKFHVTARKFSYRIIGMSENSIPERQCRSAKPGP